MTLPQDTRAQEQTCLSQSCLSTCVDTAASAELFGWNIVQFEDIIKSKGSPCPQSAPDCVRPSCRPSSLTTGSHVIWLQSEASHSPSLPVALSIAQPLPEFTSGTKCPAPRLESASMCWLAGRLDFEAARLPALDQKGLFVLCPHKDAPRGSEKPPP